MPLERMLPPSPLSWTVGRPLATVLRVAAPVAQSPSDRRQSAKKQSELTFVNSEQRYRRFQNSMLPRRKAATQDPMTATAVIRASVLSPACLASIQKNALATAHDTAPKNKKRLISPTENPTQQRPPSGTQWR
jgi:hypothetical protein